MKNYFAVCRCTANRNIVVCLPKTHDKEAHCRSPFIKLTTKINVCRAPLFVTHGKQAHLAKSPRPTTNNPAHHQPKCWDRRSREDRTVQIRQDNYINTAPPPQTLLCLIPSPPPPLIPPPPSLIPPSTRRSQRMEPDHTAAPISHLVVFHATRPEDGVGSALPPPLSSRRPADGAPSSGGDLPLSDPHAAS
jgi:hypothetical protein